MMTANLHNPNKVESAELPGHRNDVLQFDDAEGNHVSIYMLPHLARAMADAYAAALAPQQAMEVAAE